MNKQDWTYKKLGDICKVLNGLWVGKKEPFVNIAVIRNTNFSKDCKLKLDDVAYIDVEERQFASRKLQVGDIIIEKSGGSDKQPVGRPVLFNIPEGDYSFSNFTSTLRLTDKSIFPPFLHYCLYGYYRNGETKKMQSKTTGLRNLDMKAYLKLAIPYLEMAEQERIVEELDLLSGIIEKKKEQLKAYDQLAQSIFYTMFGDPIDNPKGWEVKKLGEIASFKNGLNYHPKEEGLSIKCIGVGDFQNRNELRDFENIRNVTIDEMVDESYYLKDGDIIIVRSNGSKELVGRNMIVYPNLKDVTYSGFCIRCRLCSSSIQPTILSRILSDRSTMTVLRQEGRGCNISNINQKILSSLQIILPPLSLQQEFAEKVESIERQKALIRQSIDEVQTMFDYTMDKYFG